LYKPIRCDKPGAYEINQRLNKNEFYQTFIISISDGFFVFNAISPHAYISVHPTTASIQLDLFPFFDIFKLGLGVLNGKESVIT
tara:strand:- start:504 stop:755 length:252 start_codon:yes stop_codon:yes gene_type:complete